MSENVQDSIKETDAAGFDSDGSLLSTFDIVVLVCLLGAAVWWLFNSRKENKKDEILLSKYSIQ